MGGKAPEVQKYPFFYCFFFGPRITFWSHCHLIFGVCWVLKDDLQCVLCNILKRYHHRCFLQRWLILVREPQCSWSEFYWHCGVVAWLSGLTAAAGRSLALMLWLTHSLQSKGEVLLTGPLIYNLAHPHLLFETIDESQPQGQIWCLFVGRVCAGRKVKNNDI